jgi:hypothetical protein
MQAWAPLVGELISTMCPTTLLPTCNRAPDAKGTFCRILPVITWPGLDFADEMVVFKRPGKMVPLGIKVGIAPSLALAGWQTCAANSSVNRNRKITFPIV